MSYRPGHLIRVKCNSIRYKATVFAVEDRQLKVKYHGVRGKVWIPNDRNVQHILDAETDKPKLSKKVRSNARKTGQQILKDRPNFPGPASFRHIYKHDPGFTRWLIDEDSRSPIRRNDFRQYLEYAKLCNVSL